MNFSLGEKNLTWEILTSLSSCPNPKMQVSESSWKRLDDFRIVVDKVINSGDVVYGINTGFGFLSDVKIERENLSKLQMNLILSHACGVGELASDELVRALLILRAHTFLIGHSAVRRKTVETILEFLKHDILPVVPMQGSVGASGDLAPLSHLAMGLIGKGKVKFRGNIVTCAEALKITGVQPLVPEAKEGLSLINGTQFMTVIAAFVLRDARAILRSADIISALSLDAIRGTDLAYAESIHEVRLQKGQRKVAANLRHIFSKTDDQIRSSHLHCAKVQDPYSFRCIPQVHGASRDAFDYCEIQVNNELNSVTDNPLVFLDGTIVSGGNFHGQPIAIAMDFLAIAISEIGSISERRIEKLTNPHMSGLPAFVIADSGLNSGFMIPHVVAASLASENKILCHPASVDSIPTSADKEDHVSMGPIAARKAKQVCQHVMDILSIECLTAAQGIDLLKPLNLGAILGEVHRKVRSLSPELTGDRSLYEDIRFVSSWIIDDGPYKIIIKHCPNFA
ncbi:MAG: histidine ammonia-lyase [Proteobacteria bacterium]|nr:histidine ammonia-lyase [Pseudomonadota bacterium]